MILKGRLGLISKKVPPCCIVSDIGTDHAYIPIHLVSEGICERAVAADVKRGPIEAAKRNIKSRRLEDKIDARIGYGLEPIKENESDVIVIAGMGGILIKDILEKDIDKAKAAHRLVLQPMNAIEILREWLYFNGFDILDEELEAEGEKIYNAIVSQWTGLQQQGEMIDYYIGKKLIEKKDPLLRRLLDKKIKQLDSAVIEMDKATEQHMRTKELYTELRTKMLLLLNTLSISSGGTYEHKV